MLIKSKINKNIFSNNKFFFSSYFINKVHCRDSKKFQHVVLKSIQNRGFFGSRTSIPNNEQLSITYEEIGLFPRSFNRVFDRFLKQLFSDVETLVLQEYRFYRYLFLTTLKTLFTLFFVPLLVNIVAKNYIVEPLAEYFWNTKQTEIFLNSHHQKKAFNELHNFEEKLFFESLISQPEQISVENSNSNEVAKSFVPSSNEVAKIDEKRQKELQQKTLELAVSYNNSSIEAITNFFSDLFSFLTVVYLLFSLEIQINITKSFLLEFFFGLDDSLKSLFILLITDLLVGYHSPNIWELFFEFIFNHYGIPESQTVIFLLVATLPVLLDVLFKYLIFRHLNRSSPATVATYHAMIE